MRTYEQLAIPINVLTLLGIIAAGVIYYCQLTAMQGATTAAARSADAVATQGAIMQAQLEAGQRPRIDSYKADLRGVEEKPGWGGEPHQQRVIISAKNVGSGVAYRINTQGFWFRPTKILELSGIDLDSIHGTPFSLSVASEPTAKIGDEFEIGGFIPADVVENINEQLLTVVILYGWVDYCDSLNIQRRDPWCWGIYTGTRLIDPTPGRIGLGRCDDRLKNVPPPTPKPCR